MAEPNAFAVDVAIAAFAQGEAWLDALRQHIYENKRRTVEFVAQHVPQVRVVPSQATYLLWLDCTALPGTAKEIAGWLRGETGLYLTQGGQYGKAGERFLRLNIACPRATLEDGLARLQAGIASYPV